MAWSLLQHPTGTGSTTSATVNITPNSTANLLVGIVFINLGSGTPNPTISSVASAWTPAYATITDAGPTQTYRAWIGTPSSTSAGTVTFSWTGTATADAVVAEFSGLTGSATLDGTAVNATGSSTSITTPSFTPGTTGSLLINPIMVANQVTAFSGVWSAGNTALTNTGDGWGFTTGALAAIAANATNSGSSAFNSEIFAVLANASGGVATSFVPHRMPLGA